ncbi:MAG: hypothetical protein Q8Q09_24560 [Deltaproteobacteria bacterium]|nr:hypothetical protein [Deltaproteobacteria bacterium]
MDNVALTKLLALDRRLNRHELSELTRALDAPWLWPRGEGDIAVTRALSSRGLALGPRRIAALGEVLLVAVVGDGAALFALREGARMRFSDHTLVNAAHVMRCAFAHAPTLVSPVEVDANGLRAAFLQGQLPDDATLVGDSFGLSFALSAASQHCGHPVPTSIVASACVGADGALTPVRGLAQKLNMVAAVAQGVEEFWVARAQLQEAESLALTQVRALKVRGFSHVRDAIAQAFDWAKECEPSLWAKPDERAKSLAALHAFAMSSPVLTDWQRVVAPLRWLAVSSPHDLRVSLALAIAQRHAGELGVHIPWDEETYADLGLAYVAQVVQASADAGDARCAAYVSRAICLADLAPAEPASLRVRGASARALAMMRRYPEALEQAQRAVRSWERRGEPAESSYALCEWLRVSSVMDDRESFEQALAKCSRWPEDALARLYLALSARAGFVRLGDPARALGVAAEALERGAMPLHVHRSWRRWTAAAQRAVGHDHEAEETRARLSAEAPESIERLFATLDRARETQDRDAMARACAEIFERSPQGTTWLRIEGDIAAQATVLAREYPY